MKKFILVFTAAALFAACGDSKKTAENTQDAAKASDSAVTLNVNTETSTVIWKGAKKIDGSHTGTVKISEGVLSFEGDALTAGNFSIDMTTISESNNSDAASKAKLEGHLKSADFFLVDSFPKAAFEITKVEKLENSTEATHTVSGNLTIKGITHGITFPATISKTGDNATAVATFEINRNEWNIVWGGSKETNKDVLGFLKDNLLNDMITFTVDIKAGK